MHGKLKIVEFSWHLSITDPQAVAYLWVEYVSSVYAEVVLPVTCHIDWKQQLTGNAGHLLGANALERRYYL